MMKLCKLKSFLATLFTISLYLPSAHASGEIDQESVYGWLNGRTSSMVGLVNSHWKRKATALAKDPKAKAEFLKLIASKLEEDNTIYNSDFIDSLNQFIPSVRSFTDSHIDPVLYAALIQITFQLKEEKFELEGKGGILDNLSCLWLCEPSNPQTLRYSQKYAA